MDQYRFGGFKMLPPVVKNLLIINVLMFLATLAIQSAFHFDLTDKLGLFFPKTSYFKPYQFVTHIFMHGGFSHLFLNMFALWMFGNAIENIWGGKRFFLYYMVTGLGAAFLHTLVNYITYSSHAGQLDPEAVRDIMSNGYDYIKNQQGYIDPVMRSLQSLTVPTVGASGAVFGILLAFGMMFPNSRIYVYFAIPIKAKYFVMIYGAIELYSGIANQQGDNIAHFAHLGGMLFGLIFILIWKKHRFNRWD